MLLGRRDCEFRSPQTVGRARPRPSCRFVWPPFTLPRFHKRLIPSDFHVVLWINFEDTLLNQMP